MMFERSIRVSQRKTACIIVLLWLFAALQTEGEDILEPRIAVERHLGIGVKHHYQITLQKDEYAKVTVIQRGMDVVARVIGNDGKVIEEFDTELRLKGEETLELIAGNAGNYIFQVERKDAGREGLYEIRLSEKKMASDQDRSMQQARRLTTEANKELAAGNAEKARPLAERALAIQQELFGQDHPRAIPVLNLLGNCAYQSDDYDGAVTFYQRALAVGETKLSPDHPDIADSLAGLALANFVKGKYSEVKPLYLRAIEIKERAYGPDHPEVARSLLRLANIYFHISDFVQAELTYRRVLAIAEKFMGENDPTYVRALGNLANTYVALGDFAKAEPMFIRSLATAEKLYGPESPKLGVVLIQMGSLYSDDGNYKKAETFYQRALKLIGTEGSGAAVAMTNLANLYSRQGQYEKAKPLYEQSLTKKEALYGLEHESVAYSLVSLAHVHRALGDFVQADALYRRGLGIYEKLMGPDHPELVEALNGMAILYRLKGDLGHSIEHQTRANAIIEKSINYNLVVGGERQKLSYLVSVSQQTDRTISLHIQAAADNAQAKEIAATSVLQRKGRVLDWMADLLAALHERSSAEDQLQIEKLKEVSSQLASLVLGGRKELSLEAYRQKVKQVEDQREKLESEISRRSAGFYQHSEPVTVKEVQKKIPQEAALIEYMIYRPFDPKVTDPRKSFGEPRFVAYVFTPMNVHWKDLGTVKEINRAIDQLRLSIRDPNNMTVKTAGRNVDRWIMQPLRPWIGGARQLLISPDGALNFVPFEALVDEHNRYLIERFSSTYLTSGRDLLRLQITREGKQRTLVLANPTFGEAAVIARVHSSPRTIQRQTTVIGEDMSDVYFGPLIATASEARAISSLFQESDVLMGEKASESSLKKFEAPRILHIATHGFFLTDESASTNAEGTRAIRANAKIENPLLRSGLALAGANLHKKSTDDGILTAMEASVLNLWGTRLVTLSACDTGLGEVKNGEGVYGLRRAFMLAGAETVVMSLWSVSDSVTLELMNNYYKNLKKGLGRSEALREVQRKMIRQKDHKHPYYWASFIVTGEWGNLEGQRVAH